MSTPPNAAAADERRPMGRLDGLKGFDGAPFTSWTLTFSVGG